MSTSESAIELHCRRTAAVAVDVGMRAGVDLAGRPGHRRRQESNATGAGGRPWPAFDRAAVAIRWVPEKIQEFHR